MAIKVQQYIAISAEEMKTAAATSVKAATKKGCV